MKHVKKISHGAVLLCTVLILYGCPWKYTRLSPKGADMKYSARKFKASTEQLVKKIKLKLETGNEAYPYQEVAKDILFIQKNTDSCLSQLNTLDVRNPIEYKIIEHYLNDIDNYSEVLEEADNVIDDVDSLERFVDFVLKDLSLKYNIHYSGPLTEKPTMVKVRVRVLDTAGVDQPGYEVFVKPELSPNPMSIVKLNPTNNASGEVTPGAKKVGIQKEGKLIKEEVRTMSVFEEMPITVIFSVN